MGAIPTANRLKRGGAVVAVVGFLLTRYFVASSIPRDVTTGGFLFRALPFLLGGLGLSALGVGLMVSDRRPATINTVARWCLLGIAAVVAVALLTPTVSMMPIVGLQSGPLVPKFLVAGAVAGTLTGFHSARANVHRRELTQRTNRQTVLNRLLRHEVLNKLAVVRGFAELDSPDATERVERNADQIEATIDQIGFLADAPADVTVVDLTTAVEDAVREVRERYPEVIFRIEGSDTPVEVRAVSRIDAAIQQLLDNAVEHTDSETVTARVDADELSASVAVIDDGPGLPPAQRALLRERSLPEFDDPTTGFGLTIVRLLVEESDGVVSVADDGENAITLSFARACDGTAGGVSLERLSEAAVAALVAGVLMGWLLSTFAGILPIIGALYGVSNAVVGWIVHLFHSVVFGVAFAAVVWHPRWPGTLGTATGATAAGLAYGVVLSLLAAGVVMPAWLQLVGMDAQLPNLSFVGLVGHLVWGGALGALIGQLRGLGDWIRTACRRNRTFLDRL